jgi:glycopeptide antibiotics resistance protein
MITEIIFRLLDAVPSYISALIVVIPFICLSIGIAKQHDIKIRGLHVFGELLFSFILILILSITGIPQINTWHLEIAESQINTVPFFAFESRTFLNIANVLLFVPFGFFLPLLWCKYNNIFKTVFFGFSLSLFVEVSQLFNHRVSDIDDLIMNTLGTLFGYLLFMLIKLCILCIHKKTYNKSSYDLPYFLKHEGFLLIIITILSYIFIDPYISPYIYDILFQNIKNPNTQVVRTYHN